MMPSLVAAAVCMEQAFQGDAIPGGSSRVHGTGLSGCSHPWWQQPCAWNRPFRVFPSLVAAAVCMEQAFQSDAIPGGSSRMHGTGLSGCSVVKLDKTINILKIFEDPDNQTLKGISGEFQVIRGFSQKIPADLLSYDKIHS